MSSVEQCPKCHGVLEQDGTCSCGFGVQRKAPPNLRSMGQPVVERNCPDCGQPGHMSRATNGAGPWYCSEHFWGKREIPDSPGKDVWDAEHGK